MTGTRAYLAVLAVLLAGGVLLLVASGVTWGHAEAAGRAVPAVAVSGSDALPAAQAVGLLALAAVVAVHASRRWGRRAIGALLALAGGGVAIWSLVIALDLAGHVARSAGRSSGGGAFSATTQAGGPALTTVGGVLVAVAGLAMLVVGPRWPGMGSRYERGSASASAAKRAPERAPDPDRDAWKALDRGEDPTV